MNESRVMRIFSLFEGRVDDLYNHSLRNEIDGGYEFCIKKTQNPKNKNSAKPTWNDISQSSKLKARTFLFTGT